MQPSQEVFPATIPTHDVFADEETEILVTGYLKAFETEHITFPSCIVEICLWYYFQPLNEAIAITVDVIHNVLRHAASITHEAIADLYSKHAITVTRLCAMTNREFTALLQETHTMCTYTISGLRCFHLVDHRCFTREECVQIHRGIQELLGRPVSFRYDIDIGLAVNWVLNENDIFIQHGLRMEAVDPVFILELFDNLSAKRVHEMGKAAFVHIMQSHTELKAGHICKVWCAIKSFIEDPNEYVPPHIRIVDSIHRN